MSPFQQVPSFGSPISTLTSIAPSGGGSGTPQLTHTAYHNEVFSSNVTQSSMTHSFTGIPAIPAGGTGMRVINVQIAYRPLSSKTTTADNAKAWYGESPWGSAQSLSMGGSSFSFSGWGATDFNGVSNWTKTVDLTGSQTVTYSFPSCNGSEYAISLFVLDYITQWEDSWFYIWNGASGMTSQTSMNNSGPSLTGQTHALRIIGCVLSNSSNNPTYTKGASEPTYTFLGAGDNGTNERNSTYYAFETTSSSVNQNGTIATSSAASGGLAGTGLIIGLK